MNLAWLRNLSLGPLPDKLDMVLLSMGALALVAKGLRHHREHTRLSRATLRVLSAG